MVITCISEQKGQWEKGKPTPSFLGKTAVFPGLTVTWSPSSNV